MQYPEPSASSYFIPQLLGTYEKELTKIIEGIRRGGYEVVVDIGAAEGYYVCGFAWLLKNVTVRAFEAKLGSHELIRRMAQMNGVSNRISIVGTCTIEHLRRTVADVGKCLVVCDVEGAEFELLNPAEIPKLLHTDLLVEVHDAIRPNVSQSIRERFSLTHDIVFIGQVQRTIEDLPPNVNLDAALAIQVMDETRGNLNDWLWMRQKQSGTNASTSQSLQNNPE